MLFVRLLVRVAHLALACLAEQLRRFAAVRNFLLRRLAA
jgi:hypothetical protein